MRALVIVLNDESYLDSILEIFRINKVSGGTIIDSQGLYSLRYATHPDQLSIFAPLSTWGNDVHEKNKTIFSIIEESQEEKLVNVIRELFNDYEDGGKGIFFTFDVSNVFGYKNYNFND
jgi:hypothetical protein